MIHIDQLILGLCKIENSGTILQDVHIDGRKTELHRILLRRALQKYLLKR
jgi:hypothetical protein